MHFKWCHISQPFTGRSESGKCLSWTHVGLFFILSSNFVCMSSPLAMGLMTMKCSIFTKRFHLIVMLTDFSAFLNLERFIQFPFLSVFILKLVNEFISLPRTQLSTSFWLISYMLMGEKTRNWNLRFVNGHAVLKLVHNYYARHLILFDEELAYLIWIICIQLECSTNNLLHLLCMRLFGAHFFPSKLTIIWISLVNGFLTYHSINDLKE